MEPFFWTVRCWGERFAPDGVHVDWQAGRGIMTDDYQRISWHTFHAGIIAGGGPMQPAPESEPSRDHQPDFAHHLHSRIRHLPGHRFPILPEVPEFRLRGLDLRRNAA